MQIDDIDESGSFLDFEHFHGVDDSVLAGLEDLASDQEFVEHAVDLIEIEHDVEFADVAEVLVEGLHEEVDELQVQQFVVVDVDADGEVESGVPFVDDLEVVELHEVGLLGIPHHDHSMDLCLQLHLLGLLVVHEPLRQPGLALSVLEQDESDH
jgi:hypothetical protein